MGGCHCVHSSSTLIVQRKAEYSVLANPPPQLALALTHTSPSHPPQVSSRTCAHPTSTCSTKVAPGQLHIMIPLDSAHYRFSHHTNVTQVQGTPKYPRPTHVAVTEDSPGNPLCRVPCDLSAHSHLRSSYVTRVSCSEHNRITWPMSILSPEILPGSPMIGKLWDPPPDLHHLSSSRLC